MRTRVLALLLIGCGGEVESVENRAPTSSPAPPAVSTPAPAPAPAPSPGPNAPSPAPRGDAEAMRDGAPLYLTMCKVLDEKGTTLKIWGGITDPKFEVDEGIIAVDVTPPDARGSMTCGKDVRVVFAEGRGAEFEVDPIGCDVKLLTNALGQVEGHVQAQYVDLASKRHTFSVDFTAGDCN